MDKKYIDEFGFKIFIIAGITRILRKLGRKNVVKKYEKFKYKSIIKWLNVRYGQEAEKIAKNGAEHNRIHRNAPIWIFWWQGEKAMPPIVKSCYKSVIKNAEAHPVILITKYNVEKYIDICPYIYHKVKNNEITLTHFSDILRENLLYQYGGIWMDATIYMTAPFEERMYTYEYYTIKGAFEEWDWTGFFQAAGKNNIFTKVVSHLFDCYWKEHNCLISYLLIDCFLSVARLHSSDIDQMIKCLPQRNSNVFLLNDCYLDQAFDINVMKEVCKKTNLHKLSYKYQHKNYENGKITFWKYLTSEGSE